MANNIDQAVADLTAAVDAQDTVISAAITYIAGVPALIQSAYDEGIAAGATPEQMAAFTQLRDRLVADADALNAALVNNTPDAPA